VPAPVLPALGLMDTVMVPWAAAQNNMSTDATQPGIFMTVSFSST